MWPWPRRGTSHILQIYTIDYDNKGENIKSPTLYLNTELFLPPTQLTSACCLPNTSSAALKWTKDIHCCLRYTAVRTGRFSCPLLMSPVTDHPFLGCVTTCFAPMDLFPFFNTAPYHWIYSSLHYHSTIISSFVSPSPPFPQPAPCADGNDYEQQHPNSEWVYKERLFVIPFYALMLTVVSLNFPTISSPFLSSSIENELVPWMTLLRDTDWQPLCLVLCCDPMLNVFLFTLLFVQQTVWMMDWEIEEERVPKSPFFKSMFLLYSTTRTTGHLNGDELLQISLTEQSLPVRHC